MGEFPGVSLDLIAGCQRMAIALIVLPVVDFVLCLLFCLTVVLVMYLFYVCLVFGNCLGIGLAQYVTIYLFFIIFFGMTYCLWSPYIDSVDF